MKITIGYSELNNNDIVTIDADGIINIIHEANSKHNAIFITGRCNSNCIINANSYIYFGDDCLLSWNDTILDSDGHSILNSEHVCCNQTKPIYFGNHVWICSDTTILKGASVSDGSVIAAHSTISKEIDEKNVVIGGVNKIVSHNINWEE